MPDVSNIQPNSRVRVGDVTVGHVSKIALEGNHALVTMQLNDNVELPANATATVGLTTIFGSLHIELAPPTDEAASRGRLQAGRSFRCPEPPLHRPRADPRRAFLVLNGGGSARPGTSPRR